MMVAARRPALRFSLRTFFIAITLIAVISACPLNRIQQRRFESRWIEQNGGSVEVFVRPEPITVAPGMYYQSYQRVLGPEIEPEIPKWRRWLGDETYNQIYLPPGNSQSDLERARRLFPEAAVDISPPEDAGSGFSRPRHAPQSKSASSEHGVFLSRFHRYRRTARIAHSPAKIVAM